MTAERAGHWRKVRIWLGDLLIAEYIAEADRARRYKRVMAPRFAGLRIEVEAADGRIEDQDKLAVLPNEQLWSLTVG
jgi:hypothetical protein